MTEHTEELKRLYEQYDDWTGTCRKCGAEAAGTLEELRKPCKECGWSGE